MGSEMCIRDRCLGCSRARLWAFADRQLPLLLQAAQDAAAMPGRACAVLLPAMRRVPQHGSGVTFTQKHCPQCCRPTPAGDAMRHWPDCTWARISTSKLYVPYHRNVGNRKTKRDYQARKASEQRTA